MAHAAAVISPFHNLLQRLAEARARTDALFRIVRTEALYDRPIPERHRIIFYIGHLEAFDWNLLGRAFGRESFHPAHDKLFAFGIDPVDGRLPSDQPADWPALDEVYAYRERTRKAIDACLADLTQGAEPQRRAAQVVEDGRLLHVAIEHRLMHAETLAYMFHQLPRERKVPQPSPRWTSAGRVEPRMVEVPAGTATLGQRRAGGAFGWCNEFEAHAVQVPAFRLDAHKVTNAQFLEFLRAGGYDERSLWSPANWEWKEAAGIRQPVFWKMRNGEFYFRGMFEEIPLPLDWPVYVSHAEASAYARWTGKSLPSEAQWHRAAFGSPDGGERAYPWGSEPPRIEHGNFDFLRWDPTPVHAHAAGRSAFGAEEMTGNGWEWTSTVFGPFAGFERFPFYPGYSADFFDGKHYVMKGGSMRTAAGLLRRSFRNWFQAHYQYAYAGFRCVEN
jgi:ergothioneine biosynthesis protein EgtB